jgi:hypothetical protein
MFRMTYCDRFDGLPFSTRGIVLAVAFRSGSLVPTSSWVAHENVTRCWLHEHWDGVLRYEDRCSGRILVIQRLQARPAPANVEFARVDVCPPQ